MQKSAKKGIKKHFRVQNAIIDSMAGASRIELL